MTEALARKKPGLEESMRGENVAATPRCYAVVINGRALSVATTSGIGPRITEPRLMALAATF
jgi:hypothetical protein